jgi:thymidylate synthase
MAPAAVETVAVPQIEAAAKQNGAPPAKRHEEYQYLDLVQEILNDGEHRPDRCVRCGR